MKKIVQRVIVVISVMAACDTLVASCVQVQPCPHDTICAPANVTITTAIMATVPVSALPGAP